MLVFKRFGRKGYSLFSCLGREVLISTLSVATLTHASAESVSVKPVTADSIATKTDREMTLDEVNVMGSRAPMTRTQAARMVTVLERSDIQAAPVQSVNDLLKYATGVDVRQRGPIGAQTDISIREATTSKSQSCLTASTSATRRLATTALIFLLISVRLSASRCSRDLPDVSMAHHLSWVPSTL